MKEIRSKISAHTSFLLSLGRRSESWYKQVIMRKVARLKTIYRGGTELCT